MLVKKINTNQALEIYYYYCYFFKFFNIFFLKNKNLILNFFIFNLKFFYFFKNNKQILNINNNFKQINKYLNFNVNHKFNKFDELEFTDNKVIKKFHFSVKKINLEYKLFNLFFLFNYSLFNSNFKFHYNFKIFYIYNYSNKIVLLDSTKFLSRWKEAYDFLFNIFFYNFNPIIFSTSFFKNETLALNWNYNNFDINLWRYYFPFFIFKLTNYNKKTDFFFDKLALLDINFYLITDCIYHFKNLHYIKKKNFYSIGLIDANLDPWLVSYPIISFFESFLTQLFFFKFLIFIEKRTIFLKYNLFKNMWNIFFLKKLK